MDPDIARILSDWEFDPEANVRKIQGEDGIAKIQVRVDQGAFQGILQVNLDGRPDGKRPYDTDYVLDHYEAQRDRYRAEHGGEEGFDLDHDACLELFDESARIYGRYVFLLQIKEYERVIADTERNMALFRFVHRHAAQEEDRHNLQKWWPYILRIHATARAMIASQADDFDAALGILAETRKQIEGLTEVEAEEFFAERERSLEALDELVDELSGRRPLSQRERLEQELEAAVSAEEFEKAARLRDQLHNL